MSQTNVTIKMNEEIKKLFDEFCSNIGMTMSTAIGVFAKKTVSEQRIPFEITANDPFYSSANIKRLEKAVAELREGKAVEREMIELEDE